MGFSLLEILTSFQTLSIQIYPLHQQPYSPLPYFPHLLYFNIQQVNHSLAPSAAPKNLPILTLKEVFVSGVQFFTKTHNKTYHFFAFCLFFRLFFPFIVFFSRFQLTAVAACGSVYFYFLRCCAPAKYCMPLIAASGNNSSRPRPPNHPNQTRDHQNAPHASTPASKLPPPTPENHCLRLQIPNHHHATQASSPARKLPPAPTATPTTTTGHKPSTNYPSH